MPRRESKLEFNNAVCWLLGHDVDGKLIPQSYQLVSGEMSDGWHYYCKRCQNPDDYPLNQFPDGRNLYQRTISVWISRECNRRRFRHFRWADFHIPSGPAIGGSRAHSYWL